jgi:predicted anti-sigma-YlaC factor YlaD
MIRLSCEDVRREISNYLDNDIAPERKKLIEKHLEQCQNCAVLLDSMHNMVVLIADERRFELPQGFGKRLRDKLEKEFAAFKEKRRAE